jgi:hypothetical protein
MKKYTKKKYKYIKKSKYTKKNFKKTQKNNTKKHKKKYKKKHRFTKNSKFTKKYLENINEIIGAGFLRNTANRNTNPTSKSTQESTQTPTHDRLRGPQLQPQQPLTYEESQKQQQQIDARIQDEIRRSGRLGGPRMQAPITEETHIRQEQGKAELKRDIIGLASVGLSVLGGQPEVISAAGGILASVYGTTTAYAASAVTAVAKGAALTGVGLAGGFLTMAEEQQAVIIDGFQNMKAGYFDPEHAAKYVYRYQQTAYLRDALTHEIVYEVKEDEPIPQDLLNKVISPGDVHAKKEQWINAKTIKATKDETPFKQGEFLIRDHWIGDKCNIKADSTDMWGLPTTELNNEQNEQCRYVPKKSQYKVPEPTSDATEYYDLAMETNVGLSEKNGVKNSINAGVPFSDSVPGASTHTIEQQDFESLFPEVPTHTIEQQQFESLFPEVPTISVDRSKINRARQNAEYSQYAREAKTEADIKEFNQGAEARNKVYGTSLPAREAQNEADIKEFNQGAEARNKVYGTSLPAREAQNEADIREQNLGAKARNKVYGTNLPAREAQNEADIKEFNKGAEARNKVYGINLPAREAQNEADIREFNKGAEARNKVYGTNLPAREAKSEAKIREDNQRAQAFHDAKEKLEERLKERRINDEEKIRLFNEKAEEEFFKNLEKERIAAEKAELNIKIYDALNLNTRKDMRPTDVKLSDIKSQDSSILTLIGRKILYRIGSRMNAARKKKELEEDFEFRQDDIEDKISKRIKKEREKLFKQIRKKENIPTIKTPIKEEEVEENVDELSSGDYLPKGEYLPTGEYKLRPDVIPSFDKQLSSLPEYLLDIDEGYEYAMENGKKLILKPLNELLEPKRNTFGLFNVLQSYIHSEYLDSLIEQDDVSFYQEFMELYDKEVSKTIDDEILPAIDSSLELFEVFEPYTGVITLKPLFIHNIDANEDEDISVYGTPKAAYEVEDISEYKTPTTAYEVEDISEYSTPTAAYDETKQIVISVNQKLRGNEPTIDNPVVDKMTEDVLILQLAASNAVQDVIIEQTIQNSNGSITTPEEAQTMIDKAKELEAAELAKTTFLITDLHNTFSKVTDILSITRKENIFKMITDKSINFQDSRELLVNHLLSKNDKEAKDFLKKTGWLRSEDVGYLLSVLLPEMFTDIENNNALLQKYLKSFSVFERTILDQPKWVNFQYYAPGYYMKPPKYDGSSWSKPVLVKDTGEYVTEEWKKVNTLDLPESPFYLDAAEWNNGNQAFVIINTGRAHYRLVLNPNNKEMSKIIDIYKQNNIPEDFYNNDIKQHFQSRGMANYMPEIVADGDCGVDCVVTAANLLSLLNPDFALKQVGVEESSTTILQSSDLLSSDLWENKTKAFAFVKSSTVDCEYNLVINPEYPEMNKKDVREVVSALSVMYKDGEFDKSGSKKEIKEELLSKNIPGIVPIFEINSNSDSMYSVVLDTSLKINLPLAGQTPVPQQVQVQGPQTPVPQQVQVQGPQTPVPQVQVQGPQTPVPQVQAQGPQTSVIVKPASNLLEIYKNRKLNRVDMSKVVSSTKFDYSQTNPKNRVAITASLSPEIIKSAYGNKNSKNKIPSTTLGYTKEETDKTKISYDVRLEEEGKQSGGPQPKGASETWQQKESKTDMKKTNKLGIQQVIGVESTIKNK